MKTLEDKMDADKIIEWADFVDGLASPMRLAIYMILKRTNGHALTFKELQARVTLEIGRPCNTTPFEFHLNKMAGAGIVSVRGHIIRLERFISLGVETVDHGGP